MHYLKKPCANCPFRKDCPKGWLGFNKITSILKETVFGDKHFPCHKTRDDPKVCAGSLIFEGRCNNKGNMATRIMMMYKMLQVDYSDLGNQDLIFDSVDELVEHHSDIS